MKRTIFFFVALLLCVIAQAKKRVRIDFSKNNGGDFELVTREILSQSGYDAFVYYGNGNAPVADLIIKYDGQSGPNQFGTYVYTIELLEANGEKLGDTGKVVSYAHFGNIQEGRLRKRLERLFGTKMSYRKPKDEKKVRYFNIKFDVRKLDSSSYMIIARGAGVRTFKGVEEAFVNKAGQFLKSFSYYCAHKVYTYSAYGGTPGLNFDHEGPSVYGVIQAASGESGGKKIQEVPDSFKAAFKL